MDTISKENIENINENNLFLSLIEPKKIATKEVLDFIKNKLSDENLKKLMKQSIDELCDRLPTEKIIELELLLDEETEEKHLQDLRLDCYKRLEEYKINV